MTLLPTPAACPHRRQLLRLAGLAAQDKVYDTTRTAPLAVYQNEGFEQDETYSRLFDAPVDRTCEAARRALLSQGYVLSVVKPDAINGSKRFQPQGDVHVQIEFHVVCAPDGPAGRVATAYVNALQDRYTLKKNPNSASVGLAAIGSVSIPLAASDDSLVKVASRPLLLAAVLHAALPRLLRKV